MSHRGCSTGVCCRVLAAVLAILISAPSAMAQTPPALRYFEGHTKSPFAVAWSADGKTLVSGGFDETVRLWDRETGKLLLTYPDAGRVLTLAVSKDGLRLASGGQDRRLRMYDMLVREPLPSFGGANQGNEPTGLVLAADGKTIYGVDKGGLVRQWNVADGRHLRDFPGSSGECTGLGLTPTHLVVSYADGLVRMWKLENGELAATLSTPGTTALTIPPKADSVVTADKEGFLRVFRAPPALPRQVGSHNDVVTGLAVSSDGSFLLSAGNDQQVLMIDPAKGQVVRSFPGQPGAVGGLALRADNAVVATGSATGLLKFWSTKDGADLRTLGGHEGAVHAVAFHPKTGQIASVGQDGTVRLWDLPQAPVPLAGHVRPVQVAAASRDGKTFVTGSTDNTVRLWSAEGKPLVTLEGHTQPVTALAITGESAKLLSGDSSGMLRVWSPATKALLAEVAAHTGGVTAADWSVDGKQWLTSGGDGLIKLWELPAIPARTLAGPTETVHAVALAGDGKSWISGGADQTVRLFDPATGQLQRALPPLGAAVTGVAGDASGKLLAAATVQGVIQLWNADGTDRHTLTGHTGSVNAIVFHPQAEKVVSAGQDGTLRVWSYPVAPRVAAAHDKPIHAVAISPNGTWVATAAADNTVKLNQTADGKAGPVLKDHPGPVMAVAWKGDNSQLATASTDKAVRIFNADGTLAKTLENLPADVRALAFNADGTQVLWGGSDNLVHQTQIADGVEVRTIPGASQTITGLARSADGLTMAACSSDGSVRVFRPADGIVISTINHGAAVTAVAFSADGMRVATGGVDTQVKFWMAANGAAIATGMGHTGAIAGLAFAANNEQAASTSADGSTRLWDVAGRCLQSYATPNLLPTGVAFATDNKSLAVGHSDGSLRMFTVSIERVILGHEGPVLSVAFAPNGQALVSGGQDKTARSWNLADGKQVVVYGGCTDAVTRVRVSPDSLQVAAVSVDKSLRVWNLANAQAVGAAVVLPAPIRGLSWSPDGKSMALAADDAIVRVMDLVTGKELQRFPGHTGPVLDVAFSHDGLSLVSGSADKSLRQWPLAARRLFVVDPARSYGVRFAPGGQQFLTAGDDKVVKLWDLATGQIVRPFGGCEAAPRYVAMRGDGEQVAAGGSELLTDRHLYLWKAADGAVTHKIPTPAAISGVCYSPDGSVLAVTGADQHLRVYRSADGKLLQDTLCAAPLTCVAVAADNRTLLAGSADNQATLHHFATRFLGLGHEGAVTALAFAPGGAQLVTCGVDKTLRVWKLNDVKVGVPEVPLSTLSGAADVQNCMLVTPDGTRVLAAGNDKQVRVWSLAAAQGAAQVAPEMALPQAAVVRSLGTNADGSRIAVGGDDNLIHIWDMLAVVELERLAGHTGAVTRVAFAPDGQMVTASNDRTVRMWPVSALRSLAAHQGSVSRIAFSPDGTQIFSSGADRLLLQTNAADMKPMARFDVQSPIRSFAQSADGKWLATVSDDLQLRLWAAGDPKQPAAALAMPAVMHTVALSATGDRLLVGGADKILRHYVVHRTKEATELVLRQEAVAHTADIARIAWEPNGRTAFTASLDRSVRRWQLLSNSAHTDLPFTAPIDALSFSADNQRLAVAAGAQVSVLDLQTTKPLTTFGGHTGRVYGVAIPPNNQGIFSASADKSVRMWDTQGKEIRSYLGVEGSPLNLTLSPDGSWLIAGTTARTWQLWHVNDPKLQRSVVGHNAPIYRAAFNANGNRIATLDYAGELFIWDLNGTILHHQSLPVAAGHSLAYSPDGKELAIATQDPRVLVLPVPAGAQ